MYFTKQGKFNNIGRDVTFSVHKLSYGVHLFTLAVHLSHLYMGVSPREMSINMGESPSIGGVTSQGSSTRPPTIAHLSVNGPVVGKISNVTIAVKSENTKNIF